MSAPRTPLEEYPERLAALSRLPIFLDLNGKRVVIAGGGDPVVWKAELVAAAGASITVYAERPDPELQDLAARSDGRIALIARAWHERDLDNATLAIADAENAEEAARFAKAARERGIPVNVIDRPAFCDFQFGTIVNRSPVVVAVSTDGAAPILGQAIRRRIEAILPRQVGSWALAAGAFRERLKDLLPSRADRRRFWEGFVDAAFSPANARPSTDALERLAHDIANDSMDRPGIGEVAIVGAGPGDPELLTLKAMRELQAADVIVYDRLVTPAILELARREARRIHVGKEGHGASCRQEDINALVVDLALEGKRVVRLKGGDPAIFARTGEEVEACHEAGVTVRIVPGITTASAAAAALNLSLTHRHHAQNVQFVTGHDRHGQLPDNLNLAALSDKATSTVVYMGRRTVRNLTIRLRERGLSPDTPLIAIADVSRPSQRTVQTTIGAIAGGLPLPEDGPLLIMFGEALKGTATPATSEKRRSATPHRKLVHTTR
ncbi:siroheme synthase CysG [Microvirga flavescens]|uniref:siroheme synthase CysG n=1 Tax=Microvirga flavescens TaxID=2249811 RepID=UPI000DD852D6|nr:siroheme synthase CysG [Microvirga flavescens]